MHSPLQGLPPDLLTAIFSRLPLHDRCSCASVCRDWAALVHSQPLAAEVDGATGTIKLVSGADPKGPAAKAGWHAMIVSSPADRLHVRLMGMLTQLRPVHQGGPVPGVAVMAALHDLGRTKAWKGLVLDALAARWLQQQNRLAVVGSFAGLRQLQLCQVHADEALSRLLERLTSLQGLVLGMVRCGSRRFDDQWRTIGTYPELRCLRVDGTFCALPLRPIQGGKPGQFARRKVEALALINTGCADASPLWAKNDMPVLRKLIIEEADIPTSRDCPLELDLGRPSINYSHRPGNHSTDNASSQQRSTSASLGRGINLFGRQSVLPGKDRVLDLKGWQGKDKALRLKGRAAVAVRWAGAKGIRHLELESVAHLSDELAAVLLKGMLGATPPGQRSGAAVSDRQAAASSPTGATEMLTLQWPALMPALLWRLRQPQPLLPALRSLDLSHNGLSALPECPQLWRQLTALDLSHNSLGSAVPEAAFASMTQLESLDMSFQSDWSVASAVLVVLAATMLPTLKVLGLRHKGPLPGLSAGSSDAADATDDGDGSGGGGASDVNGSIGDGGGGDSGAAARVWAARHSLRCRVVDEEAAKMPPAHAPVELPLMA